MADQFFENFKNAVEGPAPAPAVEPEAADASFEEAKKPGWIGRMLGKNA